MSTKSLGCCHTTKPITNYQNIQLITLLHEEKVGKTQKAQKVKCGRHFRKGCEFCKFSQPLQIFAALANFRNHCVFGKVVRKFTTLANLARLLLLIFCFCFRLLLAYKALNYNCALHALSSIPTFRYIYIYSL